MMLLLCWGFTHLLNVSVGYFCIRVGTRQEKEKKLICLEGLCTTHCVRD